MKIGRKLLQYNFANKMSELYVFMLYVPYFMHMIQIHMSSYEFLENEDRFFGQNCPYP